MTKALDAAGAPPMTADRDADDRTMRTLIEFKAMAELVEPYDTWSATRILGVIARSCETEIERVREQASEIAALRRRVATLEALVKSAGKFLDESVRMEQSSYDLPPEPATEFDYQMYMLAGELNAALSPSPLAEERESGT